MSRETLTVNDATLFEGEEGEYLQLGGAALVCRLGPRRFAYGD